MATPVLSKDKVLADLLAFTESSTKWCATESERASEQVTSILDLLLKDASRMSAMSATTLEAVEKLRDQIDQLSKNSPQVNRPALVQQLSRLCSESTEFETAVMPIIEALQFQDRIRQVMENLVKMTRVWQQERAQFLAKPSLSDEEWLAFGSKLSKCATMSEERAVVCTAIPQVPEEKKVDDMLLF